MREKGKPSLLGEAEKEKVVKVVVKVVVEVKS